MQSYSVATVLAMTQENQFTAYLKLVQSLISKGILVGGDSSATRMEQRRFFALALAKLADAKEILRTPKLRLAAELSYYSALSRHLLLIANHQINANEEDEALRADLLAARYWKTSDGKPGETYDGYGPLRLLVFNFLYGSRRICQNESDAYDWAKLAYLNAPEYPLNWAYFSAAIERKVDGSSRADNAKKACALIDELLKKRVSSLDPRRIPEASVEWIEVKRIREEVCR